MVLYNSYRSHDIIPKWEGMNKNEIKDSMLQRQRSEGDPATWGRIYWWIWQWTRCRVESSTHIFTAISSSVKNRQIIRKATCLAPHTKRNTRITTKLNISYHIVPSKHFSFHTDLNPLSPHHCIMIHIKRGKTEDQKQKKLATMR